MNLTTTVAALAAGQTPQPSQPPGGAPSAGSGGGGIAIDTDWILANLWAIVPILGVLIVIGYMSRWKKTSLADAFVGGAKAFAVLLIPSIILFFSVPGRGAALIDAVWQL